MDRNNLVQTFENLTIKSDLEQFKEKVIQEIAELRQQIGGNQEQLLDQDKRNINNKKTIKGVEEYLTNKKKKLNEILTKTVQTTLTYLGVKRIDTP